MLGALTGKDTAWGNEAGEGVTGGAEKAKRGVGLTVFGGRGGGREAGGGGGGKGSTDVTLSATASRSFDAKANTRLAISSWECTASMG